MLHKMILGALIVSPAILVAAPADTPSAKGSLTASQIVDKNIAARGGLAAWRAVQTLSIEGSMGAGGNQREALATPSSLANTPDPQVAPRPKEETQLPFVLEMQRPRKSRLELKIKKQTAIQVYDGTNGWKLRPYLNRLEVEPYTSDELRIASMQGELDGPLVDYAAKGTAVQLEGVEKVRDRDNYRLKLTMKDGRSLHVWIDSKTFLESKIEGQPRRLDGKEHQVEVYYGDYRPVNGLQIPFALETRVLPLVDATGKSVKGISVPPEKITIEKVTVNPKFDVSVFSKPNIVPATNPGRSN